MSPHRVLYQRDPVLPFQFMVVKNCGLDSAPDCLNLHESNDSVCYLVEKLEQICRDVFIQASQNKESSETPSQML